MDLPSFRTQHFMMLPRIRDRRVSMVMLTAICTVSFFVCKYANHGVADESRRREHQCVSELTSVKHQLDMIIDYKKKIDKLLNECNAEREKQKQKYKETADNCAAIQQSIAMCQHQFEDLTTECKKIKHNLQVLQRALVKANNT